MEGGEGKYSMRESLPRDLVMEILSRLPARVLVKFRWVSKSWNSITHDPCFIHMHCHRGSANDNRLRLVFRKFEDKIVRGGENLYRARYKRLVYYNLLKNNSSKVDDGNGDDDGDGTWTIKLDSYSSLHPTDGSIMISRPCYGLLGFSRNSRNNRNNGVDIFNPTTREYNFFPNPTRPRPKGKIFTQFGFDPSTKKYKVVHLLSPSTDYCKPSVWRCEICTLGSGEWRSVASSVLYGKNIFWTGFEANGVIYWPSRKYFPDNHNIIETIVSLDLKDETFGFVPIPESCANSDSSKGEMRYMDIHRLHEEHLFLVAWYELYRSNVVWYERHKYDLIVEIWMLEDAKKHVWAKRYEVRVKQGNRYLLDPMYIWNGKILFGNCTLYDPCKETFEKISIPEGFPIIDLRLNCDVLAATLCSLRNY